MGSIAGLVGTGLTGGSILGGLFGGGGDYPSYQLPQQYYDLLNQLQPYIQSQIGQPSPAYIGQLTTQMPALWGSAESQLQNLLANPPQITSTEEALTQQYNAMLADLQATQAQQMKALESQYGLSGLSTSGAYLGPEGALPGLYSNQTRDLGTLMSNYLLGQTQAQQQGQMWENQLLQQYLNQAMGLGGQQLGAQQWNIQMPYQEFTRQQSGTQQGLQNAMNLMNMLTGQAQNQYQNQLGAYQNQQQGLGSFWGGLGQLGTSLMSPWLSSLYSSGKPTMGGTPNNQFNPKYGLQYPQQPLY